ncbi:restriction endonuclease subunit R, partial [Candidatus Parcubacteria bacterium]
MRLEEHLILNRYILHLLGARDFEELKAMLRPLQEGPDSSGQSYFLGALLGLKAKIPQDALKACDRRVMAYEDRLRKTRKDFQAFRYFQYLALLFTEIYLSRLTDDPNLF